CAGRFERLPVIETVAPIGRLEIVRQPDFLEPPARPLDRERARALIAPVAEPNSRRDADEVRFLRHGKRTTRGRRFELGLARLGHCGKAPSVRIVSEMSE